MNIETDCIQRERDIVLGAGNLSKKYTQKVLVLKGGGLVIAKTDESGKWHPASVKNQDPGIAAWCATQNDGEQSESPKHVSKKADKAEKAPTE